nr:hypothetical protein [Tanacetum cinerariifolium]
MLSQLMNQLVAQGMQLNFSSQLQVAPDVTLMGDYEVDGTQSSVVVRDKDARIQKKSNGLVTSKKEPVKIVGPKKTPKSRRNRHETSVGAHQELLARVLFAFSSFFLASYCLAVLGGIGPLALADATDETESPFTITSQRA